MRKLAHGLAWWQLLLVALGIGGVWTGQLVFAHDMQRTDIVAKSDHCVVKRWEYQGGLSAHLDCGAFAADLYDQQLLARILSGKPGVSCAKTRGSILHDENISCKAS